MKKFIAALTLLLAFSINANAQDKNASTAADKAKTEAAELTKYLGLNETQTADFTRLFAQKHKILETPDISAERKTELSRVIGDKIRASLDGKQIEKLEQNPALFKKLTN